MISFTRHVEVAFAKYVHTDLMLKVMLIFMVVFMLM